jgi:hypothetical protein
MGTYWSGDWLTSEMGTTASTSGRDRMEMLRKSSFFTGDIYTDATMKDLFETVLDDAKYGGDHPMLDLEYTVAAELSDYVIPRAWFKRQSHFDALRELAEACMGFVYCNRLGVVTVTGPTEPSGASLYSITSDNYFERTQPARSEDLANRIEIKTQPLIEKGLATDSVYTSSDDITIAADQTMEIRCEYKSQPVSGASASLTGAVWANIITEETHYYGWGAIVTVTSAQPDTFKVEIIGQAWEVDDSETVVVEDVDGSQREYGVQTYKYPDNAFIQSSEMAEAIGNKLLKSYKIPRKDVELDWRGYPAVELADPITIPEYVKNGINNTGVFYATRQSHSFDGTYRVRLDGRKISDVEIDAYQDTDSVLTLWQDTDGDTTKYQG